MIDIIIPAYDAHNTISDTIFSLAYQNISKKINVYIVNDKSTEDYKDFISFFKKSFNSIKELKLKTNKGPGYARQYGIDHSKSEYIVFIDSDDVLSSPFVLKELYDKINSEHYDVVISKMKEETNYHSIKHNYREEYLHGKIYRRKTLFDNNIRFNNTRLTEDIAFNMSIFLQNFNIGYLDSITYIWKNNRNSLTRKNQKDFLYLSVEDFIYNSLFAIKKALNGKPNTKKIGEFIYQTIIDFYLYYLIFNEKKDFSVCYSNVLELINLSEKYEVDYNTKKLIMKNEINEVTSLYNLDIFKLVNPTINLENFINLIKEVQND